MIITTHDTDGREVTISTLTEDDGRMTLNIIVMSKSGKRPSVASMLHLSESDTRALGSAFPVTPHKE